ETKSGADQDEFHLSGTIVAGITAVNDNTVTLTGRKTLTLNNKTSLIEMSGIANMNRIKSGTIVSSDIQDLSLRVTTLLFNANDVLNGDDIVEQRRNPDATDDETMETVVNDEKRRQLFMQYVNQLMNLIY
ncbi:MAG: flagellar basal body L-ring protein FlgH, partial [Spirochaetales bacterium]|nr:flagellar basal body L-ring protein FlgH [Spirochaetales bacterium]